MNFLADHDMVTRKPADTTQLSANEQERWKAIGKFRANLGDKLSVHNTLLRQYKVWLGKC